MSQVLLTISEIEEFQKVARANGFESLGEAIECGVQTATGVFQHAETSEALIDLAYRFSLSTGLSPLLIDEIRDRAAYLRLSEIHEDMRHVARCAWRVRSLRQSRGMSEEELSQRTNIDLEKLLAFENPHDSLVPTPPEWCSIYGACVDGATGLVHGGVSWVIQCAEGDEDAVVSLASTAGASQLTTLLDAAHMPVNLLELESQAEGGWR